MLEHYNIETKQEQNRLVAVRAALEIAKSAVSATSARQGSTVAHDLKSVAAEISGLADAIQAAIQKK